MCAVSIGHTYVEQLDVHSTTILTLILILLFGMLNLSIAWFQIRKQWEFEEFYVICAWCRKIGHKGKYICIEDWIDQELKAKTSHGICESCKEEALRSENYHNH